jgi:hypothetical protein
VRGPVMGPPASHAGPLAIPPDPNGTDDNNSFQQRDNVLSLLRLTFSFLVLFS